MSRPLAFKLLAWMLLLKVGDRELAERLGGGGRRPGRGEAGTKPEIRSKSAEKRTGRSDCASARVVPLQPVDHVSHQGIGDAGEGLFCQQDGCPQLVQDQGVPVHLLLSRFELETQGQRGQVSNREQLTFKVQLLIKTF